MKSAFIAIIFVFLSIVSYSQSENKVTICITGDLLLDRGVRQRIGFKGVTALFVNVKPLFQRCDFVIANLECPVTEINAPLTKKYVFRGDPIWLPEIRKAGITHLCLANNHTIDQGIEGLENTFKNLQNNQLIGIGYGTNQQSACEPVIIEKNQIRIAIFSSVLIPIEGYTTTNNKPSICQDNIEILTEKIKLYKQANNGTKILVILHWGNEYHTTPTAFQIQQAKALIDAGANCIFGHHPHVIQNDMLYCGKPIFFSLGNFIFDQESEGLIVELVISKQKLEVTKYPIFIKGCVPKIDFSD